MSKESHLLNKFNSGELSDLVHSRTDYTKRVGGARKMENMIPLIQGPMTSRSGTKYLGATVGTGRCGLIPFEYSATQAYMIEVSANMFRFIKDRALVTRAAGNITGYAPTQVTTISNITPANPSVVTAAGHPLAADDHFSFSGVSTATGQGDYLNDKVFIAVSVSAGVSVTAFKRNAQESTLTSNFGLPATLTYTAAADNILRGCRLAVSGHGLVSGDVVLISGITGGGDLANFLNGNYYRVAKVDANNFDLFTLSGGAVDTTGFVDTTYTDGTVTWVGTWHPYSQTDLFPTATPSIFSVGYTQSTNTLFLANKNRPPATLTRSDDDSWVYAPYRMYDGPYMETNTTTTTVNVNAGTDDLVASAVTGINNNTGFSQDDVGRDVRILVVSAASSWAYGTISAVKSTTTADVTIEAASGTIGAGANSVWRLGLYGVRNGYPSTVSFYQDRLAWGGVTNFPERIDFSVSGVYNRYAPTPPDINIAVTIAMVNCFGLSQDSVDSSAISVSMLSNEMNYVRWISGTEKGLVVGTASGEWVIAAASGVALTPTNINAVLVAPYGSIALQPCRVGSGLIHAQRSARKLRSLGISQQVDGFSSKDITMQSEHITDSGVCSLAYQKEPWSIIWSARDDGVLISCTYDENEDAIGWVRHNISPKVISGSTITAGVDCVACIPDPAGDRNDVYMIVRQVTNGSTARYLAYLGREFIIDVENGIKNSTCLDASYTVLGTSSNTITASWLASSTCTVVADGQEFSGLTANGSGVVAVTGGLNYRNLSVGVPFTPFYDSLDLVPSGDRAPQGIGKVKKINQSVVRLYRTLMGKIGRDTDHVDTMNGHTAKTITGVSIGATAVITTSAPHGYETGDTVLINKITTTAGTDSTAGLNGETYTVVYISSTTFSLKTLAGVVVPTTGLAYSNGGGEVLKISNGFQVVDFPGDFERDARVCIKQTSPFPITVLSATIDLETKV